MEISGTAQFPLPLCSVLRSPLPSLARGGGVAGALHAEMCRQLCGGPEGGSSAQSGSV